MDIVPMLICGFVLLFLGALSLGIAKVSINGTLPRNYAIGIRTLETKKSDEAWNAAHLRAAPSLKAFGWIDVVLAVVVIIVALTIHPVPIPAGLALTFISYSVSVAGFVWAGVVAHQEAKRINHIKASS